MTIHQLPDRCWELQPPTDDERRPHFDTEAEALDALKEDREGDAGAYPDTKPVQMESPCWVVQCDGQCETVIDEEDECYAFHHESRAEAEETVAAWRWRVAADLVYCGEDAPDDSEPSPPTARELEAAGQLALPGVAP